MNTRGENVAANAPGTARTAAADAAAKSNSTPMFANVAAPTPHQPQVDMSAVERG